MKSCQRCNRSHEDMPGRQKVWTNSSQEVGSRTTSLSTLLVTVCVPGSLGISYEIMWVCSVLEFTRIEFHRVEVCRFSQTYKNKNSCWLLRCLLFFPSCLTGEPPLLCQTGGAGTSPRDCRRCGGNHSSTHDQGANTYVKVVDRM